MGKAKPDSTFDVERSTCPQCLDTFPKLISAADWHLNNYINPTYYAWQAGVQCSFTAFPPVFPASPVCFGGKRHNNTVPDAFATILPILTSILFFLLSAVGRTVFTGAIPVDGCGTADDNIHDRTSSGLIRGRDHAEKSSISGPVTRRLPQILLICIFTVRSNLTAVRSVAGFCPSPQ
jgi:hypothetical protein